METPKADTTTASLRRLLVSLVLVQLTGAFIVARMILGSESGRTLPLLIGSSGVVTALCLLPLLRPRQKRSP